MCDGGFGMQKDGVPKAYLFTVRNTTKSDDGQLPEYRLMTVVVFASPKTFFWQQWLDKQWMNFQGRWCSLEVLERDSYGSVMTAHAGFASENRYATGIETRLVCGGCRVFQCFGMVNVYD